MDEEIKVGRERRRRRFEDRVSGVSEIQMVLENTEQTTKAHVAQSSRQLLRRDTFTVLKSKSDFDEALEEQADWKSLEGSANDSYDLKNITYSASKASDESMHETYNLDILDKTDDTNESRPVPAPRKRIKNSTENEKLSSDTDRDVAEIDLDDLRLKAAESDLKSADSDLKSPGSSNRISPPVPKPRRSVRTSHKESGSEKSGAEPSSPRESLKEKSLNSDSNNEQGKSTELPLIENLVEDTKDIKENSRNRKFLNDIFQQKKKKRKAKSLVSMMKLEKKKIPRISALLKDLKDDEKGARTEEAEDKAEFQMDSPHYPESVPNGQIYVQSKRGFYVVERDELFKNENAKAEEGSGGKMGDSTVETAMLFQKYWSRSMIYFHGILAGFAFGHVAMVTAIMVLYNYEARPFFGVYSCLSLKIHYVFYALTALCIVSCFDRLDIGHINRKHLQVAWKAPSMWLILFFYVASFGLSFSNQSEEAKFDSFAHVNETNIWWGSDEQVSLLQWYHTIWARDILVLFAWLLISLTEFPDFLHLHLNNMVRYAEATNESISLHRLPRQKQENS